VGASRAGKQWTEGLPIGNGTFGAMVYGGGQDGSMMKEFLQLNDDTFWSGYPRNGNNPNARGSGANI
jgi:alpha-L-fucosidase 2